MYKKIDFCVRLFSITTLLVQNVTAKGRAKQLPTFLDFNLKKKHVQPKKIKHSCFFLRKIKKKKI
jgi:hypothetical protein